MSHHMGRIYESTSYMVYPGVLDCRNLDTTKHALAEVHRKRAALVAAAQQRRFDFEFKMVE